MTKSKGGPPVSHVDNFTPPTDWAEFLKEWREKGVPVLLREVKS